MKCYEMLCWSTSKSNGGTLNIYCYDNVLSFITAKRFSHCVYHRCLNKGNNANFLLGSNEKKLVLCDGKSLCKSTTVFSFKTFIYSIYSTVQI